METIFKDLYQFSTYIPMIDLSFHQYLLLSDEPLLVHTGNELQAVKMLPKLRSVLDGRDLKYIFISHFEADECGGLSRIINDFPQVKPICSEATARQLYGFGLINDVITKKPGETLTTGGYELEFISYPSEMHLWEGLLAMENMRSIFFSSDLMMGFGEAIGTVVESDWKREINNIQTEQIPDSKRLEQLQQALGKLKPIFVAAGHGPCLKV